MYRMLGQQFAQAALGIPCDRTPIPRPMQKTNNRGGLEASDATSRLHALQQLTASEILATQQGSRDLSPKGAPRTPKWVAPGLALGWYVSCVSIGWPSLLKVYLAEVTLIVLCVLLVKSITQLIMQCPRITKIRNCTMATIYKILAILQCLHFIECWQFYNNLQCGHFIEYEYFYAISHCYRMSAACSSMIKRVMYFA